MKFARFACTGLSLASLFLVSFQGETRAPRLALPASSHADDAGLSRPRTRTLRAHDFTRHSLSLRTGAFGTAIQDQRVVNVDSELDFGTLYPGQFTAGVQGGQVGELLDLGSTEELALRYGYEETVGGGQGFASIRFEGEELVILDELATGSVQPFREGQAFLQARPPVASVPAAVQLGHLYLVRIVDRNDPAFLRFAKLLVTAHRSGEEVGFVWAELVP